MMKSSEEFLRAHQLKVTAAREKVLSVYEATDHALSHSEVEDRMAGSLDRVTLYRTLKSFEDRGILHKVLDDTGSVKYSLCGDQCGSKEHSDHHLHVYCEQCGKTFCTDEVDVERPKTPAGFRINDWYMLARGVCSSCLNM